MRQAIDFWKRSYENGWFARWGVIDKTKDGAIGAVEEFRRDADGFFTDCGLLRLDLRSDYEKAEEIEHILSLVVPVSFGLFQCKKIATKAFPAAAERHKALNRIGFWQTDGKLTGPDGTRYGAYCVLEK